MKYFLILFSFFVLIACSNNEQEVVFEPYKTGDIINLTSVAGASIELERTQNGFKLKNSDKIIMFDIFGTYCTPCQKEAPYLMDYQIAHNNEFMIIGLVYFDDSDKASIIKNFAKKYNAYYFISNDSEIARLVEQITMDINYKRALEIPFKVVLKDGIYQDLSDNLGERGGQMAKFYLGEVKTELLAKDIQRIQKME